MIIKNAYMIDPVSGEEGLRDIYISADRIVAITNPGESPSGVVEIDQKRIIDASGMVAIPGLVDIHVHFRDPGFTYKEDISSGACAAAAGGFTSVVMMANTNPAIDNEETLRYVLNKGKETPINVYSCANITYGLKGEKITAMDVLKNCGAVGFTDDGIPLKDASLVENAMKQAAKLEMPLSFHEEDPRYISQNGINADEAAKHYGIDGSPRIAEISLIERDIKLAEGKNVDIVIQHISTAEGVELIRKARQTNPRIHAEVTPHHFTLTEQAVIEKGTLAKMNPPLRTDRDRAALIEGLRDGTLEIIATDHAPHSVEEKAKPLTEAPSGIIGLETSLGLGIRELVKPGILSMRELVMRMSTNPARLYKIDAGYIGVGGPADITILDMDEEWIVGAKGKSKATNTPFVGEKLNGRIHVTICGGEIAYEVID